MITIKSINHKCISFVKKKEESEKKKRKKIFLLHRFNKKT